MRENIYVYIYVMENCVCKMIQLSVKIARNFKWNLSEYLIFLRLIEVLRLIKFLMFVIKKIKKRNKCQIKT